MRITAKVKNVDEMVESLDPNLRATANKLRILMKKTLPEVVEIVKWGNPTYLLKGKNFASIMLGYEGHLNLGFWRGAKVDSKLLEGTGKGMRHIKVWRESDINEREFAEVIRQAAKFSE
jgi:hypothetical protein